jgi:hypothetical protein
MSEQRDTIEPFPIQRRGTVDALRMAGRRSVIHGLVEFDVTEARRRIHDREERTGEGLSFTAFLVQCVARALEDYCHINAYCDWWGQIIQFDDVDMMVIVEVEPDGNRIGVTHIIRAANRRSLGSIHDEIGQYRRTRVNDNSRGLFPWPFAFLDLYDGCSFGSRSGFLDAGNVLQALSR